MISPTFVGRFSKNINTRILIKHGRIVYFVWDYDIYCTYASRNVQLIVMKCRRLFLRVNIGKPIEDAGMSFQTTVQLL